MKTLSQIRKTFTDYFVKQGHTHVPSSPLVPQNDPTLMFTAAGMVQFKDLFTGNETRSYTRATTAQKCLRAGGKHNDLDNVGYTARHHTFFEMLGNFSFGDYFKEDAISFAYDMVTKEFALDQKRLLVTVYAEDDEAALLWKKIGGFSDDRIIRISTSDNFWSMGDTGPCGPCSEIFFDHGDHIFGGPPGSKDEDGDRFIEIWNLVFMQYEQMPDGSRISLPKPSIDTGMGLERISSVLQGKHNNFDIDLFAHLIDASKTLTGNHNPQQRQSHNVIADHLRASAFLIADGVLPSNEGRGYVLRRILRRAMRHAHLLGAKEPLMHRMIAPLIQVMGDAFPELHRTQILAEQTLLLEEERFNQTLDRGLKLLNDATIALPPKSPLPGDVAFKLYDTYGFPLDLTEDVLRGQERTVDHEGFNHHMAEQKKRARAAWAGSGDSAHEHIWLQLREQYGSTEFLGYTTTNAEGVVLALVHEGMLLDQAKEGQEVLVLLNQTPFYAESGGQVGDKGQMIGLQEDQKIQVTVFDCVKKVGSLFAHKISVDQGVLKVGMTVRTIVDQNERAKTAANHSATHLLQEALRRVLGDHVCQKGSHVDSHRLRFDFTHPKGLSEDDIIAVETIVNGEIQKNHTTRVTLSTPEKAIQDGALALFGEKYGDEVRVVAFGTQTLQQGVDDKAFSVELCGGTHVKATGEIGLFKITSEASVASGVRRIEAITGLNILNRLRDLEHQVITLKEQNRKTQIEGQKQIDAVRYQTALTQCHAAHQGVTDISGVPFVFVALKDVLAKDLKSLNESVRHALGSGVIVIATEIDDKAAVVVSVSPDLMDRVNAVDMVKCASLHLGGKGGGGKPDLAQGGGDHSANIRTLEAAMTVFLEK